MRTGESSGEDADLRQVLETCRCCLSKSNSQAQACCAAVDKDAGEAAQLCQEMLSSSTSLGSASGGGSGRQTAADGTRASALGFSSAPGGDERDGVTDGRAAPFLQAGMVGGGQGGKVRLPGMSLGGDKGFGGGKGMIKGDKRGTKAAQNVDAPAAGFYASIYDLIHVSMTVWVGVAILLVAATMLLVKRSLICHIVFLPSVSLSAHPLCGWLESERERDREFREREFRVALPRRASVWRTNYPLQWCELGLQLLGVYMGLRPGIFASEPGIFACTVGRAQLLGGDEVG